MPTIRSSAAVAALAIAAALPAGAAGAPFDVATGSDLRSGYDVAVDAAGTGHFVWNTRDNAREADVTHYCRVPRGATACAPGSERTFVPFNRFNEAKNSTENLAGAGPFVRVVAPNGVVVVTDRVGDFNRPAGAPGETTSFAFVSGDGGHSFGGQQGIGTMAAADLVVGRGAALSRIGGGAVNVQSTLSSPFPAANAELASGVPNQRSIALDAAGRLVAAYANIAGTRAVRRHSGSGDPNDVATWGPPLSLRGRPQTISGGPRGPQVLLRPPIAGQRQTTAFALQAVTASGLGPARPAVGTSDIGVGDIAIDSRGRVHLVWAEGRNPRILYRTSPNGRDWSRASILSPRGGYRNQNPEVAVGPNGDGFAVWFDVSSRAIRTAPLAAGPPIGSAPGRRTDYMLVARSYMIVRLPAGCVAQGRPLAISVTRSTGGPLRRISAAIDGRSAGADSRAPFTLTPRIRATARPGGHVLRLTLRVGSTLGSRTFRFSVC